MPDLPVRSRIFFLAAVAAFALASPSAARAQADTTLPAGAKVRITEPGHDPLTGRFWYLRADTLYFTAAAARDTSTFVALTPGQRVEYSRGTRRELWSTAGALLGGAAGVLAASLSGHETQDSAEKGNAVVGGAVGVLAGGVVGWLLAPERWVRVEIPIGAAPPPPPSVSTAAPPAPR